MFSGFMLNAWAAATIVGVVAGAVGFFAVLRGSAFATHAIPNGAFAGAAGAALIGANAIVGLGTFSILGALGIGALGRRARNDVATALAIVMMLGLGALFLSMTTEYAPEIYSLLFGEVLGIASSELLPSAVIGIVCVAAVLALYRPLMLSSVAPDVASARGISGQRMEVCFLLVIALTTAATVPVVGTLLTFSLLISPAAAARSFTSRPGVAMCLAVLISLTTVWAAIAISYISNLPVGFFVGTFGVVSYGAGRAWHSRIRRPRECG
jgi:zinc/manganese transport system permease protein